MAFQAGVGAWAAALWLSDLPLGSRFGLADTPRVTEIQLETGEHLDDIRVRRDDGGVIVVQCKTRPGLERAEDSDLAQTIEQLVSFERAAQTDGIGLDRSAAVMAVARGAPASLDHLERACRFFDLGASWADAATLNQQERAALEIFQQHATRSWRRATGGAPSDADLARLARLFRIARFDVALDGHQRRDAAVALGTHVIGQADAGRHALGVLIGVIRGMIESGAPAKRDGLMRALRREGVVDRRNPIYDVDLECLTNWTNDELRRLRRHTLLPIDDGVPIARQCVTALGAALCHASGLVTGEPGAGKTGALVALAAARAAAGAPVVFLSVDRFRTAATVEQRLRLDHPVLDVLAGWPGSERGLLVIDALDAGRGDASEPMFLDLIDDVETKLVDRWSVVASVRSFDLRNGRSLRRLMAGTPLSATFCAPAFVDVRHFDIPRLSAGELEATVDAHPQLARLIAHAPARLLELIRNPFNLSLAAELIAGGVAADSIRNLTTQSDLITRYEDERLTTHGLRRATAAAVSVMVEQRTMSVRAIAVGHDDLDGVLEAGVLTSDGDRIQFAHHVLFDHAAGRFYLDPNRLADQISDPSIGLFLGPSFRFALETLWRDDAAGRHRVWRLLALITGQNDVDPVVVSIALRTIAEQVASPADVDGLRTLLTEHLDDEPLGRALSMLARFLRMHLTEAGAPTAAVATAWAQLAEMAGAAGRRFADAARAVLYALSEHAWIDDRAFQDMFGRASRALLSLAWELDLPTPLLAVNAIRFVCKSYPSDPAASRALLERILGDRFERHAPDEAGWLAEGAPTIAAIDPDFAIRIYETLFGRPAPSDEKRWFGGAPSRILAMTSTARQDYESARYRLREVFSKFLEIDPQAATRALVAATIGIAAERRSMAVASHEIAFRDGVAHVFDDMLTLGGWHHIGRGHLSQDQLFTSFATFLRACPGEVFRSIVETCLGASGCTSVWARLLGVARERPGVADDLLWPLSSKLSFLGMRGLRLDAEAYVAAVYASQSPEARADFEQTLLAGADATEDDGTWGLRQAVVERVLSIIGEDLLASDKARIKKRGLEAEQRASGDPPMTSVGGNDAPAETIVELPLADRGVHTQDAPDHDIQIAIKSVETALRAWQNDERDLPALWRVTQAAIGVLDRVEPLDPIPDSLHAAWGAVSNAVALVAEDENWTPGAEGVPDLDELLAILDRLSKSPHPEAAKPNAPGMLGYGSWAARVYAAAGMVDLARRFGGQRPDIVERLWPVLSDPTPVVRLEAVKALDVLWNAARPEMWDMMEQVAHTEPDFTVLGFCIDGPIWRLFDAEPERCDALTSAILERLDRQAIEGRDEFSEPFGLLAARLWIDAGRPAAKTWLDGWIEDPVVDGSFLWSAISSLRHRLFRGYREADAEAATAQDRARDLLHRIVCAAAAVMRDAVPVLSRAGATQTERDAASKRYQAAEGLIDHACNQLFFGSGAYTEAGNDEPLGLASPEAKRAFLEDYAETMRAIGESGTPRTLYNLFQLYEFTASAAPAPVFDRVAGLLLGPAAREGYHHESLASDAVVRLVRWYLADHRDIFASPERRHLIVQVLNLFSAGGSPDALDLMFQLPDLLR
ncbi:ATP-binding protein [Hansschlegelia plantiphila]|uniref:Uncharacterized protein n=1 Tax=Hansschlegelia plantiphila TaxID=374655 RepID=A0A9W6J357_9HYPH|nr:ATP-binding protein [Hansschlegelia plantiphila]GLK68916.1 hypothetical protein GCM10008179_25540 [Hansschlegelia plantiphila]